MFNVVAWPLFIHFLPSNHPKMRLGRVQESDDLGVPQSLQSISFILGVLNESLFIWRNRFFRDSPSLVKSLCAFGSPKMPFGRGRENDFSRKRLTQKSHFLRSETQLTNLTCSQKL
jgi:hypothetical protein